MVSTLDDSRHGNRYYRHYLAAFPNLVAHPSNLPTDRPLVVRFSDSLPPGRTPNSRGRGDRSLDSPRRGDQATLTIY
jgi:hypothetical protein